MAKLISLADLQHIKFISAKVASAKVNKTKVPAFLCSLDVGQALLEVHFHLSPNCGRPSHVLYPLASAPPGFAMHPQLLDAYVFCCFGYYFVLPLILLMNCSTHFASFTEPT